MPVLDSKLRSQLDDVCQKARDVAVAAAESALKKRAVDVAEPFAHFGPKEKELRNRLRARGRQVGDVRNADKTQSIEQLSQELAYEFWHRMLFARFLAENNLLMHPDGVAVSLEECEELAKDADPPAPNGFVLAARYASTMLPQIFRTDDVLLEIDFAPEQRLALEKLLASLPRQTFEADDSLGWVYQFWQTKRKDEVNAGGDKIDGRTLPAVTQLFTEHYMVEFLLHNTIGAWWCAKEGIQGASGGAGVPPGKSPVQMPYLRWREDGTPAAGKFEGWPKSLKKFMLLDPCCGSGHFLVSAFNLLVPLRMHDEGLSAREACDAVLRENLHGLELDPRCTQIAAFALALAAWKYPDENGEPLGYRELPSLNIACSGQGVAGKKEEWVQLANGDDKLRNGMERLYELFEKAPHLGSLIDPRRQDGDLFTARHAELDTLLKKALAKHTQDADLSSVGVAAQGITAAADLLARQYALVITNVPYLGRGKQEEVLREYIETHYAVAKADLATAFVMRCLQLCAMGGSTALVTPQSWLFLGTYRSMRELLLNSTNWNAVARLGTNAFQDMNWWAATTALTVISKADAKPESHFFGIDVNCDKRQEEKAAMLRGDRNVACHSVLQSSQFQNPDVAISFSVISTTSRISDVAFVAYGSKPGQTARVTRQFWELDNISSEHWQRMGSTPEGGRHVSGKSEVCLSISAIERYGITEFGVRGSNAWGKRGVIYSKMARLPAAMYLGEFFDDNTNVIVPLDPENLAAIYAYVTSDMFNEDLRQFNQKSNVTKELVSALPFDLAHWQSIAAEKYPNGLPEPHSDDPTQWLFKGDIATSTDPLQVAVARLLDYRWPDQPKEDTVVDPFVDDDGIVCLPGVRHEPPAAERLADLLRAVGYKTEVDLSVWLRDKFFEEHCKRFNHRPFIWHIWDGRKDGFSALVNYHKLSHKTLENLTYSYLGDWISAQSKSDKEGADLRLAAAQALQEKLKLILAGEPPYDIFVRWKPLHEQSIGWHPDLNDGVRMNIRPFVEADILRKKPNIKWTKDRGKEPERDKHDYPWFWSGGEFIGDRENDVHLSNEKKTAARSRKKGAK